MFNDGKNLRDMTYIKDIIDGIQLCIKHIISVKEDSYHEVFNLGITSHTRLICSNNIKKNEY